MSMDWQEKVEEYCEKYNIPLFYLAETMYEPKVVPMIRGKAFEFSVMMALQAILTKDEWEVTKVPINAQIGLHDVDVLATHRGTKKDIRVECKLSKKESFRLFSDGSVEIRVKCMRSRTLGANMVRTLAPRMGVSEQQLTVHNDQYLPGDFDVVITSIGNAFYTTDPNTGLFEWEPSKEGISFLEFLKNKSGDKSYSDLKDFAFNQMYVAKSDDLVISKNTNVVCTRRSCSNQIGCGFIPNYPIIHFNPNTNKPTNGWIPIEESLRFFRRFVDK